MQFSDPSSGLPVAFEIPSGAEPGTVVSIDVPSLVPSATAYSSGDGGGDLIYGSAASCFVLQLCACSNNPGFYVCASV